MRISHCGGGCALFYLRFCQFLLYLFWGSGDLQGLNQETWTWPSSFFVPMEQTLVCLVSLRFRIHLVSDGP